MEIQIASGDLITLIHWIFFKRIWRDSLEVEF